MAAGSLGQAGQLKDPLDVRARIEKIHPAAGWEKLGGHQQNAEAGSVDVIDIPQVEHEMSLTLPDQIVKRATQPIGVLVIDLSADLEACHTTDSSGLHL